MSNNKKIKNTISEDNKNFRLVLKGIDLMESRNYDIFVEFVLGDGYANLFLTPDDVKKTMRIYLDEESILKFHEQLCNTYIHIYDDVPRHKLNKILQECVENLKV